MRHPLQATGIAVLSLVLATGLVAFADPANASLPGADAPHIVVATADLNLASAAGLATARRRIDHAAEQVCGFDGNAMSASGQCRDTAVQDADLALQRQVAER